jgi:hypothetical protein
MNLIKFVNRQTASLMAAIVMLLGVVSPALVPAFVSAAAVTQRSIQLSNSSVSATGVTYQVNFKSVAGAGAFVVDFCSNSPVIGQTCTAPAGMTVAAAASTTSGFTTVDDLAANTVRVTGTIAATTDISVELTGITNPSAAGPVYARILTYANATNADGYTAVNPAVVGPVVDSGSVAISITDTIGVSGAVLESMLFCISGSVIGEDCTGTSSPVLALGETVGATKALVPTAVSTGSVYAQISTNAVGGAVIRLKSNAIGCGGLLRAGATGACDILPALNAGIIPGEAKFGVLTNDAAATPDTDASGVLQPVSGSGYNNDTYALNYDEEEETGVTSLYGDPFLDTDDGPVNNQNMQLTFGASVSNQTPAGQYSANLSMIATGKF